MRLPRLTSAGVGSATGTAVLAHTPPRATTRLALLIAGGLALACLTAYAAPAVADPLPTNDYAIDLFQGPLLSPIRVTALSGAYAGMAEGTPGLVSNAASPAVRPLEAIRHVETALNGSLSFPVDLFESANDFDNSGELDADYSEFIYATGGAILQVGAFGVGLNAELQSYTVSDEAGRPTNVVVGRYHGLVAVALGRGQLALGGGARGATMGIGTRERDLVFAGAAPEIGILVRPDTLPFRFGATYRFQVEGNPLFDRPKPAAPGEPSRSGALTLPRAMILPWEIETGLALQVGPRPLQVPFDDPEDLDDPLEKRIERDREDRARDAARVIAAIGDPAAKRAAREATALEEARARELEEAELEREHARLLDRADDAYANLARYRLLLLMSVLVSGPVSEGVSLEKFLAQGVPGTSSADVIGSSGASINFSPRFGVELEPIPRWLILRAGSYYEPNRFGGVGRQHFTFGSEVRVFESDVFGLIPPTLWGVMGAIDLAPRYQSLSVSLGFFR